MGPEIVKPQPWRLYKNVLPQHTDYAGVMWHGAYLSWLEEARVNALSQAGFPYAVLSNDGYEIPVVHLEINFLSAALHGEKILLESWALPRKGVRWPWYSKFLREGNILVAKAKVELVLTKTAGKRMIIRRHPPDQIQDLLLKLQAGP